MHFNYDFSLVFYLAGLIFFLFIIISKRRSKPKNDKIAKREDYWLSK